MERFRQMQSAKAKAEAVVIANLLYACTHLGALGNRYWCADSYVSNRIKADIIVENPLIGMYAMRECAPCRCYKSSEN